MYVWYMHTIQPNSLIGQACTDLAEVSGDILVSMHTVQRRLETLRDVTIQQLLHLGGLCDGTRAIVYGAPTVDGNI